MSDHDISQKYETDIIAVRQQANTLQRGLQKEVKSPVNTVSEDCHVINNLKAEQDAIHEKMGEEVNVLQQNTLERERSHVGKLEEQKMQLKACSPTFNLERKSVIFWD